jgi:Fe-S oxidoreductase
MTDSPTIPARPFAAPGVEPYDKHGDMPDADRVDVALRRFVRDSSRDVGTYLEACIHCGSCADACHFYVQTKDPHYTPIYKIEPLKRAYKREVGPLALAHRLLGLTPKLTLEEMQEWEHYVYDSCTMCGRCTMACPMGIDIASLVETSRHAFYEAGVVPARLHTITEHQHDKKTSQSATPEEFRQIVAEIREAFGVEIPLDEAKADVLVSLSASQLESHRDSFANTAKILNHLGLSWTVASEGFEATNFGMLSGFEALQKEYTMRLVDAAIACKAKTLLLPECGHAYGALRWRGPQWYGAPFPFEVLHMSEFLGQMVTAGKLRLDKIEGKGKVTYHDPCQTGRRGGVFEEPRAVLAALGLDLREMADNRQYNWCCGGGGGVLANARAEPLRAEAFRLKIVQVEHTGAKTVVSACHQCEITFEKGRERFHWEIPFVNLVELVAENLAKDTP